jgi:hypothetical protein
METLKAKIRKLEQLMREYERGIHTKESREVLAKFKATVREAKQELFGKRKRNELQITSSDFVLD